MRLIILKKMHITSSHEYIIFKEKNNCLPMQNILHQPCTTIENTLLIQYYLQNHTLDTKQNKKMTPGTGGTTEFILPDGNDLGS